MSNLNHCVYIYVIVPDSTNYINLEGKQPKLPFKVGISSNVQKRLAHLQTGSFIPLKVVGITGKFTRTEALSKEKTIHSELLNYRSIGEWFMFTKQELIRKKDELSILLTTSIVNELIDLCPYKKYVSKDMREYWEVIRFKKECEKLKPYITNEIFWKLIEEGKVKVNNSVYGLKITHLKPKDRIEIATAIFGSYKNYL